MGLVESLGLIVGSLAGAMALPFVMERLERGLEKPQPNMPHRRKAHLSRRNRVRLPSLKTVMAQSHRRLPATRP